MMEEPSHGRILLQGSLPVAKADWTKLFPEPAILPSAEDCAAIMARYSEYEVELRELFGADGLSEHVMALAIRFNAYATGRVSSIARRRERLQRLKSDWTAADKHLRSAAKTLGEFYRDDSPFVESIQYEAAVRAIRAFVDASKVIGAAAESFNQPQRGDNRRVVPSPLRFFHVAARTIFEIHGRAPVSNFAPLRELLYEVVTGEPGRSFAKLDRGSKRKSGRTQDAKNGTP
jgi:hypothetical protein